MLPFLRQRNLLAPVSYDENGAPINFSQEDTPDPPVSVGAPVFQPPQQNQLAPQPMMSSAERLKALYDAENNGPAMKAFQQSIQEMPQRQEPGKFRKFLAGAAAVGASQDHDPNASRIAADNVLNAGFDKKMGDWQRKSGALKISADLEDKTAKERIAAFNQTMKEHRDSVKDARDEKLDAENIKLHQAQTANYESLVKARGEGSWQLHENKVSGHVVGINAKTGEVKDFGVSDLTPQQKAELQVQTYGKEEGIRQKSRVTNANLNSNLAEGRGKRLATFRFGEEQKKDIATHEANRKFDVANPLTVRAPTDPLVSPQQQQSAIRQAVKEVNLENSGKYSHLIDEDSTGNITEPSKGRFGGAGNTSDLKDFYKLVQDRADKILSKKKSSLGGITVNFPSTGSRATASPSSRIEDVTEDDDFNEQ